MVLVKVVVVAVVSAVTAVGVQLLDGSLAALLVECSLVIIIVFIFFVGR